VTVVVIDTSVYVSALVFGGVPQAAVNRALDVPYRIAVSREIAEELVETLEVKFGWPSDRIGLACEYLWQSASWFEPVVVVASRDSDDDHVLGCAVASAAALIITGDKDLLSLRQFQGVVIVTPSTFLSMAH
jgi:predicted nucleic acid-binding protein